MNPTFTRILLICGVLSSLHYVLLNVFVPLQWPEYSIVDQTVSELSAIGAPTRGLWVSAVIPYILLFAAFGWGVMKSAIGNRKLHLVGVLILIYSAFNLYWPPMHLREILAGSGPTLTDTLHLVWAGVTVLLFVLIMGFGAAALGKRFRVYTIASLLMLTFFGILTGIAAPNVQANLPTPWAGVYERINIGVFLAWVAVLATALLRKVEVIATRGGG